MDEESLESLSDPLFGSGTSISGPVGSSETSGALRLFGFFLGAMVINHANDLDKLNRGPSFPLF